MIETVGYSNPLSLGVENVNLMTNKMIQFNDLDGDSELTASELKYTDDVFSKLDSDGSGAASMSELVNVFHEYQMSMIEDMTANKIAEEDTDGDGMLSADEAGVTQEMVDELDSDGDGLLSEAELNEGHPFAVQYKNLTESLGADLSEVSVKDLVA
ncbi:MAG: hypothetical protein L3V56_10405 [Candidatus Magnetoovum sp. WYHC-5]|nr:hypothetical protein [Candidatus Magnetoovum sp. WYHC-5]